MYPPRNPKIRIDDGKGWSDRKIILFVIGILFLAVVSAIPVIILGV